MKFILFFISLYSYYIYALPVAVIHGLNEDCSKSYFPTLIKLLKYNVQDFAVCLNKTEGLSLSFEEYCERTCEEIKSIPQFKNDFSILSISQGGLIARYIIQKCDMEGNVKKLVSFGGPMMGTSKVPFCIGGVSCFIINSLVDFYIYNDYYQKNSGLAGYYRSFAHIENFENSNSTLFKLNNPSKKEVERFKNLTSLVLIGFKNDRKISPKESAEFGAFDSNSNIVTMTETDEYKNDKFGLKTLNEEGKVKIFYLEGGHSNFDFDDVLKYAVNDL